MKTELEGVNWVLVNHYWQQARVLLQAADVAVSDEAKRSFTRTAVEYMKNCMQQFEHVVTGRGERVQMWASIAATLAFVTT